MLELKIASVLISGILNSWGGYSALYLRRFTLPCILAITVSSISHVWYLGFTVLPVIGTLVLGYFSGHNWGRALWLFLQAVVIGAGVTVLGHLTWYFYLGYILGAGILGGIYKDWEQRIGDFITGIYLGIFIFFIH